MHRLDPTVLADLDLPATTTQILAQGLPVQVTISSSMPTVFSSALNKGLVHRTLTGSAVDGYVIGSIREQQGHPVDYSWFVIERRTGHVYVTDHLAARKATTFVNSDVGRFLASIRALVEISDGAQRTRNDDEQAGARLSDLLRERLYALDPLALARSGYWQAWLDDLLV